MEENQTLMNADNDLAPLIPSSSTHHRPQIRRSILRQTTTTRSSPYNASASNFHRRQTFTTNSSSLVNREEFFDNNENLLDVEITDSSTILEPFQVQEHISNGNFSQTQGFSFSSRKKHFFPLKRHLSLSEEELLQTVDESQESYHSLSTVDFDSDEIIDDHHFYYSSSWSSSSPPVFDYSSLSSEPAPIENHSTDLSRRDQYENDGPSRSSVNENLSSAEDLSIEIILETSQNDTSTNASDYFPSSSTNRPRRRSILPTTIVHHRGLRLSEILSIPQKIYGSIKEQHNEKYPLANSMINTECSICFEDFHSFDTIKILHCQHVFHS